MIKYDLVKKLLKTASEEEIDTIISEMTEEDMRGCIKGMVIREWSHWVEQMARQKLDISNKEIYCSDEWK